MRALITIFLVFINIFSFGQTKLDTIVFNKVNEYRVSMSKEPLKWDTTCSKAAKIHTNYLYRKNYAVWPATFSGHTEDTLVNPVDRFEYVSKEKWMSIGEVALAIGKNYKVGDTLIYDKMATEVVNGWKLSKKHNEIILSENYVFGGVSCDFFTKGSGLKGIDNYRVVATMILLKK